MSREGNYPVRTRCYATCVKKRCIFCLGAVNSAEHIWSEWILNDLKLAPPVRATVGYRSVWMESPTVKIKTVCGKCNNGWMSKLEEANKLPVHSMINDEPCGLTKSDQTKLSRWAMLKAMVVDSANPGRRFFFSQDERSKLRELSAIPERTLVWVGRLDRKAFHAGGTDIWGDVDKVPKASHGNVTTLIIGHLVIQLLTLHVASQFSGQDVRIGCLPDDWPASLLSIWPTAGLLRWPAEASFSFSGNNSVVKVLNRWKIGENIG